MLTQNDFQSTTEEVASAFIGRNCDERQRHDILRIFDIGSQKHISTYCALNNSACQVIRFVAEEHWHAVFFHIRPKEPGYGCVEPRMSLVMCLACVYAKKVSSDYVINYLYWSNISGRAC